MNPIKCFRLRAAFAALALVLVPVSSLPATPPPPVVPLVNNLGFEATPALTGWTTSGGTVSLSSSNVHTGSYSASVVVSVPGHDGVAQDLTGKLIPGRSYLVSAWVKLASGASPARIGLHVSATANGIVDPSAGLVEQPISDAGGQWHYVTGAFELDTNAAPTALGLLITSDDVATSFYVDDVAVYPLVATGLHNVHSSDQVRTLGAGAVRQVMNLYQFEDNLAALTNPGSWSIVTEGTNHVLGQTSPNFSTNCNLTPGVVAGAGSWTDYILSVDVRFDHVDPVALDGTATLRFAIDGSGDSYALTIGLSKLTLAKVFANGTQFLTSAADTIGTGTFHTYAVTFDATHGTIAVSRDGTTVIPATTLVDGSLTAGSVGLGSLHCTASFDNLSVTPIAGGAALFADNFEGSMNWTGNNAVPFKQLTSVGGAGVPVVFSLSFWDPRNPGTLEAGTGITKVTKIPTTTSTPTAATVTSEIANFLNLYGPYLSIFDVENEPNFEYSTADRTVSGGTAPAIEWLRTVAQTAQTTIAASPSTLGGIRVASGSMVSLYNAYTNPTTSGVTYRNSLSGQFLAAMLNWADTDPNVDFIDFHAHEASEEQVEQALAYLQGQSTKPLIVTEWSEALAVVQTPSWLAQQISSDSSDAFLAASSLPSSAGVTTSSTNAEYIAATYLYPVPSSAWNSFIAVSPLAQDPGFLQNVTDLYNRNGVVVETYGDYDQYGDHQYDLKALYANLTVQLDSMTHSYKPNATYVTQFTTLTPTLPAPDDQIYFEDFHSGTVPWTTFGGTWSVSGGAFQQTATSGTSFVWVDSGTVPAGLDSRVAAEITPTAFYTTGNSVGLLARYTSASNRYAAIYRDGNHTLVIQKVSGGTMTNLASTSYTLTTGQAHRFEFDVQGTALSFYVDHVLKLHTIDSGTPLPAGQVGAEVYNATASLDNVDVRQPQYRDDSGSAANWTTVGGSWSEGGSGYAQSSSAVTAAAYLGALGWSDYTVEAQITPTDVESAPNALGLVARYTPGGSASYYALLYQQASHDIVLLKVAGATQTVLADLPIDLGTGQTSGLKLEVRGSQLRGYLNGRMICSQQDSSLGTGAAGVMTNNATGTFAQVVVTQLNAASP